MKTFFRIQIVVIALIVVFTGIKSGYRYIMQTEIFQFEYENVGEWTKRSQAVADKSKEFMSDDVLTRAEYGQLSDIYDSTERYVMKRRAMGY